MKSADKKQTQPDHNKNTSSQKKEAPLVLNTAGGVMPDANKKDKSKEKLNQDNSSFRK